MALLRGRENGVFVWGPRQHSNQKESNLAVRRSDSIRRGGGGGGGGRHDPQIGRRPRTHSLPPSLPRHH